MVLIYPSFCFHNFMIFVIILIESLPNRQAYFDIYKIKHHMIPKSLFLIFAIILLSTQTAAQCPINCEHCDTANKCTQCNDHYYINGDSQCSKCMDGSTADECKDDDRHRYGDDHGGDDDHHDDDDRHDDDDYDDDDYDDDHHRDREDFLDRLEEYEFYIEGTLRFDKDIDEFQKEDGQDVIVKKIAYFLQIEPRQVVVRDIYEGSTVFVFAVLCDDEEKIKTYGEILENAEYPYPVLEFESSQPERTEDLLDQMQSRRIGMIVGIVIGSVAFVVIVAIILWCFCIKNKRKGSQITGSGSGSVELNNDKEYQMTNNGNVENNYYQKELQS